MARIDPIAREFRAGEPAIAFSLALLVLCVAGCEDLPTESDYRDRLSEVTSVSAPDSAQLGTSFDVVIDTQGPNGCWRKGDDTVDHPARLLVQIEPHDREYTGPGACTQNIVRFQHTVPVAATETGTLEIEIRTRLRSSAGKDSVGVIEKLVTVYQ